MESWLPIAILAAGFLGLLGVRVAFLLILRHGETGPRNRTQHWPQATVIQTRPPETPQPTKDP